MLENSPAARKSYIAQGAARSSLPAIQVKTWNPCAFADQGPREASLLHEPWTSMSGDAEDLRKSADLLVSLRKDIVNVFTAKSGLSAERVEALTAEETWLGADVKQAIRSRICGRRYGSISSCCDCILSIRSLTMDRPSASGPAARLALSK